ncbi:MAG TPA: nucleoside 2-deoxyribosyltransferase [Magnetospirillaceae bacterium]|jgi:nucleoside 2-deoxyribosyltransferase
MKRIYLAGPDVFLPNATEFAAEKKKLCAVYGFEGLVPADKKLDLSKLPTKYAKGVAIYRADVDLMRQADFGIFHLTPFDGPSADVGTVFELGWMTAIGKACLAYTNSKHDMIDRMKALGHTITRDAQGWPINENGMRQEDFEMADNLMIDGALEGHDFPMVRHDAPPDRLYTDLTGFETCLKLARERLGN